MLFGCALFWFCSCELRCWLNCFFCLRLFVCVVYCCFELFEGVLVLFGGVCLCLVRVCYLFLRVFYFGFDFLFGFVMIDIFCV